FGNFDATGAYQADDSNGQSGTFPPVDASGTVNADNALESTMTFNGAVDLANQLAASEEVDACYALQEFRYALGRLEASDDACSAQQMYQAFKSSNYNLQSVIIGIVRMDSFRYHNVETAGSACQ
ncbi:MAG: DUF1585 domain-containing protein, partial [Polyangiaceae bacterium]|nr:DUF1585 domain-containing protein [Polyangiaceae bacterium]